MNRFRDKPFCSWCNVIQDAKHSFFFAISTEMNDLLFFGAVQDFQPFIISLLLFGNDTLNNVINTALSRAVHWYIKNTKRFTNTCFR